MQTAFDTHQNFPFPVSFQAWNRNFGNRSRGYNVISFFVQVLQFFSCLLCYEKTLEKWKFKKYKIWWWDFASSSFVSELIFKTFSSERWHAKLSVEKRIFEMGSETKELRPKTHGAQTKLEYLHIKWNNVVTPASISKISVSLESWHLTGKGKFWCMSHNLIFKTLDYICM